MKAFEVVLAHVEDRILEGHLRVGSVLPAERNLAVELGVSRTAVREAMRTLQAQGIIESSVGAGGSGGTRNADHRATRLGTDEPDADACRVGSVSTQRRVEDSPAA